MLGLSWNSIIKIWLPVSGAYLVVCRMQGELSAIPKWVVSLILNTPFFSPFFHSLGFFFMFVQALFSTDCLVREAMWSLCLCLSLERPLLWLHNVSPFVLKHISEASGIISGWSGRPFHGIVWHERAIWVGGRDYYPTWAKQKERNGSWICEAEPEGVLWLIHDITAFILIHI